MFKGKPCKVVPCKVPLLSHLTHQPFYKLFYQRGAKLGTLNIVLFVSATVFVLFLILSHSTGLAKEFFGVFR